MPTVLLVDDNAAFRETYADAIALAGLTLIEAADGARALNILETESVDIVVTDLLMPNMDGLELIMAMQERRLETPVLLFTGGLGESAHSESDLTAPCLAAARVLGAVRTLRKPLLPSELIREIRTLI